jgi:hypothetical protein
MRLFLLEKDDSVLVYSETKPYGGLKALSDIQEGCVEHYCQEGEHDVLQPTSPRL